MFTNVQDCVTITTNTKFILVSWDVARPGLWYGIEVFGTRSQFKTMERTWPQGLGMGESITKYTTISYDNVQNVGSKLATCMSELKNYEDLTLHFPLVAADYMIKKDNLELLNEPYQNNSCRCEPLR